MLMDANEWKRTDLVTRFNGKVLESCYTSG